MVQFCLCLGPKGKSVQPPGALEVPAVPCIIPLLWRSAPLHTHACCWLTCCMTPITKTILHKLQPAHRLHRWLPWHTHISHCQVLLLICTVHKPEACVYIVAQKSDWSHLCNCVVPSKQNVKLTKEYVPPLLPLPVVFFFSSEWNKTQFFVDCMGKKSQTDYSLLFPTMERASLKMSAWKATGTDMVNNGWYWFSSPVLFFCI